MESRWIGFIDRKTAGKTKNDGLQITSAGPLINTSAISVSCVPFFLSRASCPLSTSHQPKPRRRKHSITTTKAEVLVLRSFL